MKRIMIVATALLLLGCSDPPKPEGGKVVDEEGVPGVVYEITIKGMPCLLWIHVEGEADNKVTYTGLDCDWRER